MAEGIILIHFCLCSSRYYTAPTDTLTPDDAVDVLEELLPAQNKSYELGLKMKLPQHVVEAIHSKELPPDKYLLKVLIKFLHQAEPRPTWRVIIEALRSPVVDLPVLARRVEAAHFPNSPSDQVVPKTPAGRSDYLLHSDITNVYLYLSSQTQRLKFLRRSSLSHPLNPVIFLVREKLTVMTWLYIGFTLEVYNLISVTQSRESQLCIMLKNMNFHNVICR